MVLQKDVIIVVCLLTLAQNLQFLAQTFGSGKALGCHCYVTVVKIAREMEQQSTTTAQKGETEDATMVQIYHHLHWDTWSKVVSAMFGGVVCSHSAHVASICH